MLHINTIAPETYNLLQGLSTVDLLKETRLVGGTSLALQYGHRNSVDLDFFGKIDCDAYELTEALRAFGTIKKISQSKNIKAYIINGIKVDIVNYNYAWIDSPVLENGLTLASDKDIAAMKINAIMGSGSKKDFLDLYSLLQRYELKEVLEFYTKKYTDGSLFRAVLSLNYFDDADPQPSPIMCLDVKWEDVKHAIKTAVNNFNRS